MPAREGQARAATARVLARMPLVRELVENLRSEGFRFGDNVMLFGVQHIMDQTLALCWALNALGLPNDRIGLCGKAYSYCPDSADELRALGVLVQPPRDYDLFTSQTGELVEDIEHLAARFTVRKAGIHNPFVLVLDDGGQALTHLTNMFSAPFVGAGVEQTASGFWQTGIRSVPIPIVDVGSSGVKRLCEPPIVIEAVLQRARARLERHDRRVGVGVVGLGFIGASLAKQLHCEGYEIAAFDSREDAHRHADAARAASMHEVIERSDIIFGCTGADITRGLAEDVRTRGLSPGAREFVSLSSGDDEFYTLKSSLLASGSRHERRYSVGRIPDICGSLWGSEFRIARNGFPINFDNGRESVPLEHIQGTICALLGALCQARRQQRDGGLPAPRAERLILDLDFQTWLLRRWRRTHPFPLYLEGRELEPSPRRATLLELSMSRTAPASTSLPRAFGSWTRDR